MANRLLFLVLWLRRSTVTITADSKSIAQAGFPWTTSGLELGNGEFVQFGKAISTTLLIA
jgi:hypothetical protein